MQTENDYDKEVYNGDIGYIDDIDPNAGEIVASFDGRSVTYGFGELDMLVPAYATTIHKSQGSEYPDVIIPVFRSSATSSSSFNTRSFRSHDQDPKRTSGRRLGLAL
jgi:exodeoxyribonuclease V alpha subunit